MKDKFIKFGDGVVVNLATVIAVFYNDDGSVRVYVDIINSGHPDIPSFWDYEGEMAQRIRAFFDENSTHL
jgi:hypothetical protein